jgi:hypothetical protein
MNRNFNIDIRSGDLLMTPMSNRGPKRRDRAAQAVARNAGTQANQTEGQYNSEASGIGSRLIPYETQQMLNPTGESQKDIGAQLTNSLAGAGGATAGLTGAATKYGEATRNPNGFSSSLDAAARDRTKAAAGVGSDIAAKNAQIKLGQQSDAAKTLAGIRGGDVDAQLKAEGVETDDANALTTAGKSGWLENMNQTIDAISGAATGAANLKKAF